MLPTLSLDLVFEALDPVEIPVFSGSVWRGAFGYALKRVACVMRLRPCEGCPLETSCVYTQLFDTRPLRGHGLFGRVSRAPHPFAIAPAVERASLLPGEQFGLRVTLIGHAARWMPVALRAYEEAAARGIGPGRGRLVLAEARDMDGEIAWRPGEPLVSSTATSAPLPPSPRQARLSVRTPLRLRRGGRLVGPAEFTAADLVMAIARRASELCEHYGAGPITADFKKLKAVAGRVTITRRNLEWREYQRYSTRQHQRLAMGGVVGDADLDLAAAGDGAAELWPFLMLGAVIGAGKGTTMGFGAYEITPVDWAESAASESI
jgi:CRISPR-associated endoribonuclease Cas6